MIWNNVAERANSTFPVKFRAKETGFAIMESRSITDRKLDMRMNVWIGRIENDSALLI